MYVQAISAYAPHPNAAKLWMEYLYSDEGQIAWLKGYCNPIRYDAMVKANAIPADVAAKLPDTDRRRAPDARPDHGRHHGDHHGLADHGRRHRQVARLRRTVPSTRRSVTDTASPLDARTAPPARPGRRRFRLTWLGVVPFFLFATLFLLIPTLYLVIGSFTDANGPVDAPELRRPVEAESRSTRT